MSNIKTPLEVIQEGERKFEKIVIGAVKTTKNCYPEIVLPHSTLGSLSKRISGGFKEHNKNLALTLLQALHDELEGKKRKVWSELEFSKLGFMEMHQAGTDVSYNQAIKDQQDNLQALMDKIQV